MQYIFLNSAPGTRWRQNDPSSVNDALFREPLDAIGTNGTPALRLGLAFILSYHADALPVLETTLRRLLALAERHDTPILLSLDGQNWWGGRPDLWNWWDPKRPGYDRANRENVERTGWEMDTAVKICWRNWGRQIRVLPPPNLCASRFRDASVAPLARLAGIIKEWGSRLPEEKRHLYPGVKVGWEASIGINAYHYPGGNALLDADPSQDPTGGLDMKKDFAGGLPRLGYAAVASLRGPHPGPVTLLDHERVTADYLAFLTGICRRAGLPPQEVFTHAGAQFAPWHLHYSHRVAINPDSLPGWSLYGHMPDQAGDLAASLDRTGRDEWCAAEWLPHVRTSEQWADAYRRTLAFRRCHFIDLYNWEGIRRSPDAITGLRQALRGK
jgi:hypothetical protein